MQMLSIFCSSFGFIIAAEMHKFAILFYQIVELQWSNATVFLCRVVFFSLVYVFLRASILSR